PWLKLSMSRPRIVAPEPVIVRPSPPPAWLPLSAISGVPLYPGWDSPSINTGLTIAGRGGRGVMVWTPAPGISNSSVGAGLVAALEARMAGRSGRGPLAAVLVTVKVDSTVRSSSHSKRRTIRWLPGGVGGETGLRRR